MSVNNEIFVKEAAGVFLDPANVGSSVRWSVEFGRRRGRLFVNSEVSLSDCHRTINWSGFGRDGLDDMERKLNVAITQLANARSHVRIAKKLYDKRSRKKRGTPRGE